MSDETRGLTLFFPGIPEGQKRPRVFQRNGRTIAWSPKSAWRNAVYINAIVGRPKKPLDCALWVRLMFAMPVPKSDPSRNGPHTVKPDLDNLSKAVLDALKDAGWFVDDSRIAKLDLDKTYAVAPQKPGCLVLVDRLP